MWLLVFEALGFNAHRSLLAETIRDPTSQLHPREVPHSPAPLPSPTANAEELRRMLLC